MKPIVNIADAPVSHLLAHGDIFEMRMASFSDELGATRIGANLTTVPPGKAAFPFHHHYANEEHFFVVRGNGLLRFGETVHAVRPGDYIVAPAGGPEFAHQLVNTGNEDLVYLGLSTRNAPEVVGYPDSGKTGVAAVPYGAPGPARFVVADDQRGTTDYWDGEDGKAVRDTLNKK